MREAGWDPPENQGQGGGEPPQELTLVDVMLKLDEMTALLKLIQSMMKGPPAQARPAAPPPQQGPRQGPPPQQARPYGGGGQQGGYGRSGGGGGYGGGRPQGGSYGRGGGGGGGGYRSQPRQDRPTPGDGFPRAEERWFDSGILEQELTFGKNRGARWGDLLADEKGRQYLEWLVSDNVEKRGRDPNRWEGMAGRAALWCLTFGDGGGGGGGQREPGPHEGGRQYTEDVPF
jgi:hypothetical protein